MGTMKNIFYFFMFVFFFQNTYAQTPDWIDFNYRNQSYPSSAFFTGFSWDEKMKSETPSQLLERLEGNATTELIESVQVTVESETVHNTLEMDEEVHEQFKQASTSFSRVNLTGLKLQTFYDKKDQTGYALAYVEKPELIKYYENLGKQNLEKIGQRIGLAEEYISKNNESRALQEYLSCLTLLRETEEAMAMVILLRGTETPLDQLHNYHQKVVTSIDNIYRSEQLDLEEVCRLMTEGLTSQAGKPGESVLLSAFTYQDTRMSSAFTRRFKKEFEHNLIKDGAFKIVDKTEPGKGQNINYVISGTYWEDGDRLKIIAILRESASGKPLASSEGYLPVSWLNAQNISWKPENFVEAQENMMAFTKNEITGGGLQLDVWTNKGNDSPLFLEGDTLRFFVRASHPCNLRIINHFADGSKVLLYDNYPVSTNMVNRVIQLPAEFICASPFGVEVLQVNAQTGEFPPLKTENKYGYEFVTDDLNAVLTKTRGFKPVSNKDLKAEKRITVTTMSKDPF